MSGVLMSERGASGLRVGPASRRPRGSAHGPRNTEGFQGLAHRLLPQPVCPKVRNQRARVAQPLPGLASTWASPKSPGRRFKALPPRPKGGSQGSGQPSRGAREPAEKGKPRRPWYLGSENSTPTTPPACTPLSPPPPVLGCCRPSVPQILGPQVAPPGIRGLLPTLGPQPCPPPRALLGGCRVGLSPRSTGQTQSTSRSFTSVTVNTPGWGGAS